MQLRKITLLILLFSCFAIASDYKVLQKQLDSLLITNLDSLYTFLNAKNHNESLSNDTYFQTLYNTYLGIFFIRSNVHSKAINHLNIAYEKLNKIKDNNLNFLILRYLGTAYRHTRDYEKAKSYYLILLNKVDDLNQKQKAELYNRIGDIYRDQRVLDSAFTFYSLSIRYSSGDLYQLADNYSNLGDLFKIEHKYDSSDAYYSKANVLYRRINDLLEVSDNLNKHASLNIQFNKLNNASKLLTESLRILKNFPLSYQNLTAHQLFITLFEKKGEKDSVIKYLKVLVQLEKKLRAQELNKTISLIELESSLKTKDLELSVVQKEKTLSERVNLLLYIIIGLIFFLLILIWRQFSSKKKENVLLAKQYEIINHTNSELKIAYESLTELNKTKDKFFSIIAHDLKSPFQTFISVTNLLYDDYKSLSTEELASYISTLKTDADNIYKLLQNLLEWSRIKRNLVSIELTELNLYELADTTVSLQLSTARNKGIKLENRIPCDINLLADYHQISTILRNLVSNSIKFTNKNGSVTIDYAKDNNSHVIKIIDTGIGMPESIKKKLFDLGSKVSREGTAGEPSTGLGLIICKEYVHMHKGEIWVESEVNVGTTFCFSIPI